MVALAERSCTPCRAGVRPLTPSECATYLVEVPDWELRDEARTVTRRFRFPDYRTALAFANAVSALAEESWHHPELVGLGLLRGIVDNAEDRRAARVRFRDGGPHRCARLRSARLLLVASTAPTEEHEPKNRRPLI